MANVGGATDPSSTQPPTSRSSTPSGEQPAAAGVRAKPSKKEKRGRSHSGPNNTGWIRVGRSGKPLFSAHHSPNSTSPQASGAGLGRDPITAVAAAAAKHRHHLPRATAQPAHPQESAGLMAARRASSGSLRAERAAALASLARSSSNDSTQHDTAGRLSSTARRRLRRKKKIAAEQQHSNTSQQQPLTTAGSDDFEDIDSSDDMEREALHSPDSQCADPAGTDFATKPTTAQPTPSTVPRGSVARPGSLIALKPHVRCTDGVVTRIRTLHEIVSTNAQGYQLEADTPVVRPARVAPGADGASVDGEEEAMPAISLGDALDHEAAGGESAMERHPSTVEVSDGYHSMQQHHRSGHPTAALTFPPSVFTVEGIATPNTYYALPADHHVPPPLPVRHTFQDILLDYDPAADTFLWHGKAEASERFADQLELLCKDVTETLRVRPLLRQLEAPAYVLGDIHGNFGDLSFFLRNFLVLNDIHLTPCQILCLGDYVDRGPHSVECVALLFALAVEAPDRVVLLRGNHEDRVVCGDHRIYGDDCFWAQCCRRFGAERGTRLFRCVTRVFKDLPLACELTFPDPAAKILCTHGGFPRFSKDDPSTFHRIEYLRRDDFPRFLTLFPNNPLAQDDSGDDEDLPDYVEAAWFTAFDLAWSDPTTGEDHTDQAQLDANGFCCNIRGNNVMSFSQKAVEEYLRVTGYSMLFRAHQEKQFGLRLSKSARVLTLFSSSNYQGHGNGAGCAVVDASGSIQLVMKT
jgi:hypothetical protein